jgi:hypothetical protein
MPCGEEVALDLVMPCGEEVALDLLSTVTLEVVSSARMHPYPAFLTVKSKVCWVRDDSHVIFCQKIPAEKGGVRRFAVLMQQPYLLSAKFGAKSSHIFTQSPYNVIVVCGIDCLACQDEFFVNNFLDVKENYEHALHLSRLFFCLGELA